MLLWINGPFGVGKTQTALEIHRRSPGSVICDPEQVGHGLQRMLPRGMRGDVQDLRAWRQGVYEVLDLVLAQHEGLVIAPMTLTNSYHFDQIIGRLRDRGREVHHVSLLADPETVADRISNRELAADSTTTQAVAHALDELRSPEFATHVDTEGLTIEQIADEVAQTAGITLESTTTT